MPRSLQVIVHCDNCFATIENGEHDGLTMTINGVGPKQLDICLSCVADCSINALLVAFDKADNLPRTERRGATRNTNQSTPSPCPACDHVAGSAQGLGRHTRSEHGATVAELRGKS